MTKCAVDCSHHQRRVFLQQLFECYEHMETTSSQFCHSDSQLIKHECVLVSRVAYNTGFKGRFDFPLLQQHPVDLSEEGMGLDALLTALAHHAAQALGRVLGHKLHTNKHTQNTRS